MQVCTFSVAGEWFGLPVTDVQEVMRAQPMTVVPRAPKMVSGLIHLRGQIVTAIDLRVRLGVAPAQPGEERLNVMVRDGDDGAVCLIVDAIGDVLELADGAFERPPATLTAEVGDLVRGVYKLDGRLLLLLDVSHVTTPAVSAASTTRYHEQHPS
jgi:purine-binding chemotaxis protein CheW